MRLAELEDDYRCKHGVPRLSIRCGILSHAVNVYTPKMFSLFEKELTGCIGVRMKEVCRDYEFYTYEAIEEGQQRAHKLHYNPLTFDVFCSCKLFQSLGILCRHALKVFDLNNLTSIPTQFIMKRWTKEAKKGIAASNDKSDLSIMANDEKSSKSLRLSELMHEGNNVYNVPSMTISGTKIVKEKLAQAIKLLEKDEETINVLQKFRKDDDHFTCYALVDEPRILNPPTVKAKGTTNARLKSTLEKRKRKAKKGNKYNNFIFLLQLLPLFNS
ncbi:protein FAR1-RELATED SEQUENCE 5-like [Olea europaea var. sylvestris]|uniref:protein FAR1-RELATED SEQUENCE 5-like n=1 Tax=Olea europaea var. sylvestris TaxID=158386 RepID=UPI000C1D78CC|nr:protein FAR1-RELATED SEQUENCE 5-like [Olea europaea var. sylvestris]